MSRLCLFNCDNDLALANFSPGFTPPSNIRMMMEELSQLPLAWEAALPSSEANLPSSGASLPSFKVALPSSETALPSSGDGVSVWGWSPAVCHRLRQMGVDEALLPTQKQLQEIRRLSSRERAVELLSQMRQEGVCEDFRSVYCTDEAQVEDALGRWPRTILKAPWSGSGKGLRYGQGGREDTLRGWYQRIIQQQGGVVVEPLYNKVYDLAMEFWSDGEGSVTYQGLSLFDTHPNGAYRGNLLMPEKEKEEWLGQFVPASHSLAVRRWLEQHLGQMIGRGYRGYLGVDMMLTAPPLPEGEKECQKVGGKGAALAGEDQRVGDKGAMIVGEVQRVVLHPMVEVNLRMTMGMVSILLQRLQPEGFRGVFRLDYFSKPEELLADNLRMQAEHPAFRVLASGPHYRAYVMDTAVL